MSLLEIKPGIYWVDAVDWNHWPDSMVTYIPVDAGWQPGKKTLKPGPDLVGKVWKVWKIGE